MKNEDKTIVLSGEEDFTNNKSETEILEEALVREVSYNNFEKKYLNNIKKDSYVSLLRNMMYERDIDTNKIVKLTGIGRSYYYQVLNGDRIPSRDYVILIGVALSCSLEEVNLFLKIAEKHTLYVKDKRDSLIIFAISNKYSIKELNKLLEEHEEQIL